MALKNLFLKDYTGVDEDDYSIAVYTQHAVYDSLFYALDQASLSSADKFCSCLFYECWKKK